MTEKAYIKITIALLAATLLAGTFLSLCLTGLAAKYLTPALVIALPMATLAVLALSSLCVWGSLFTIPMYYMMRAALRGTSLWRVCLPMLFMQALMTTLNHVLSGMVGWRAGAWCALYELLLLAASLLLIGPYRVKNGFGACFHELKAQLDAMKAQDAEDQGTGGKPPAPPDAPAPTDAPDSTSQETTSK